jgi:uncharacterized Tic20 family protein
MQPGPDDLPESAALDGLPAPTADERKRAALCHLLVLTGYAVPLGDLIGPLVVWRMYGGESDFVAAHGRRVVLGQAFYLIVSLMIYLMMFLGLTRGDIHWVVIGALMLGALSVFELIGVITGAIRANDGSYSNRR